MKTYLEGGGIPPDVYCSRCERAARAILTPSVALRAALAILSRIEAAGLTDHYEGVAAEAGYPPREPAA